MADPQKLASGLSYLLRNHLQLVLWKLALAIARWRVEQRVRPMRISAMSSTRRPRGP